MHWDFIPLIRKSISELCEGDWRILKLPYLLSKSSHKWSMRDKSALYGGQSSGTMHLSARKFSTNSDYMWPGIVLLKISEVAA